MTRHVVIALAALAIAAACAAPAGTAVPNPTPTTLSAASPTPPATTPTPTPPVATPTPTPSPIPTPTPSPTQTPAPGAVAMTVSGRVTSAPDGRAVAGARMRFSPAAISGGCPVACPRPPGPDVEVTSDANGAYSARVWVWTLEALADSSSSQLSLFLTPPAGMKVVAVTQSSTLPVGPIAPNVPEWYFFLERRITGPIDITLAQR